MKKIALFFLIIIIIIVGISYMYLNYKAQFNNAKKENMQFDSYYNKELTGAELTTIINKAIDNNEINQISKNDKGKYIDNENNSINIDIKMIDNDKTYNMETLFAGGMHNFVQYYSQIKFKCTNIEYHKSTNKVKYLLFEQITE